MINKAVYSTHNDVLLEDATGYFKKFWSINHKQYRTLRNTVLQGEAIRESSIDCNVLVPVMQVRCKSLQNFPRNAKSSLKTRLQTAMVHSVKSGSRIEKNQ